MPRRNRTQPIKRQPLELPSCGTKRAFASRDLAKRAGEMQMLIKPDLELQVYHCDICRKWHLTRQQKQQSS